MMAETCEVKSGSEKPTRILTRALSTSLNSRPRRKVGQSPDPPGTIAKTRIAFVKASQASPPRGIHRAVNRAIPAWSPLRERRRRDMQCAPMPPNGSRGDVSCWRRCRATLSHLFQRRGGGMPVLCRATCQAVKQRFGTMPPGCTRQPLKTLAGVGLKYGRYPPSEVAWDPMVRVQYSLSRRAVQPGSREGLIPSWRRNGT